jgi:anti-sigma factor (TIGR02949 family)
MRPIDRLSCEEVFRRLDDYVDRELAEDEVRLVREHLETCAVCAAEYTFETSVLRNVRKKLGRVQAPPDLMAKIARRIAEAEGA